MKPIALSAITAIVVTMAFAPGVVRRGSRRGRVAQRQSARLISATPVVQLPARLQRGPDTATARAVFDGLGGPYFVGYVLALGFIIWLILASG